MKIIYEPKGKALEYAELAVNLYSGCDHGCIYCYAPRTLKQTMESFREVKPKPDALSRLVKDADYLSDKKDTRPILMSFATDPYCHADVKHKLTRQALEILLSRGLNVTILTKGGARADRDFDIYREYPDQLTFAITLAFSDEEMQKQYEPNTASVGERLLVLEYVKKKIGLNTWVSLEPVFNAAQTLDLIDRSHEFVDLYKVGTLNYHSDAEKVDWKTFYNCAQLKFIELKKDHYFKKDLIDKVLK
jgi:DNA repair photolyase